MLALLLLAAGFLPTDPGPYHLASGDLNGDGFPDVVIACRGELLLPSLKRPANDTVTVYLTAGSAELKDRQNWHTGFGPYTSAVADLDGDGLQDVAVVNFQSNDGRDLSLYWGTRERGAMRTAEFIRIAGDHVYDKQRTKTGEPIYPTPGLTSIAVVDVDRDGKLDLVGVAWSSDFFVVLRNLGGRRFAQTIYPLPPGPRDVAVADFDRDGIADLAFSIYSSNLVEVWRGDPSGGFRKAQSFHSQGHIPYHLKAGDVNGDGWPDLVVGNRGPSDNAAYFKSDRGTLRFAGSFAPRALTKSETTDHEFRDVLLYDLDRDGKLDLLAADHVSHKVIVWPGTGKAGFGQAFGAPREIDFPGKGPRALLPMSGRIGVAFFDSNEFGWLE